MSRRRRFLVFHAPLIAYLGFIFFLSSRPSTYPGIKPIPDYYLHGAEYCILYFLMFRSIHEGLQCRPARNGYWLPVVLTVLYGISDEIHQWFVPTRDASLTDVAADLAGALVAALVLSARNRMISFFRQRRMA